MDKKEKNNLGAMRHSCEHVLTQAVLKLYPGVKMAMGPATDEGFYFDFDPGEHKISEADFDKIEAEMRKIISADLPINREELALDEARKIFDGNEYKKEWINEIREKGEKKAVIYKTGDEFVDLCSGPHVLSTGKIGPFKLLSIAGAYWRGDEKNKMLVRIYGTCFENKKDLDKYLWQLKEAKKRDHRKLGVELELFGFDDEVGPGLPLWYPKGAFIRHKIMEFALNTYLDRGYELVSTPHIASNKLWKHSGHTEFFKESMYGEFGIDTAKYRLKPMNCPLHVKMYKSRPRSYRELPIRWTEMGTVYRYERAGVLHGLTRVRGFTQDDAHIICREDQLEEELLSALKITFYIFKTLGFEKLNAFISIRDPKDKGKYIGDDAHWKRAEDYLKKAADKMDMTYEMDIGGAVFYGPKIDIKVADSLGRDWQLSTIQVDFNLPERFEMTYIDKDGKEKVPYIIHRALLGSLERFIGIYIEHTAGAFPVWLSMIQAKIIPISEKQLSYAGEVAEKLKSEGLRVKIDDRNESLPAKVRDSELEKVPYMLIVGAKEKKAENLSVRARGEKDLGLMTTDEFTAKIKGEVANFK